METIRDTKEYFELKLFSFKDKTRNLISTIKTLWKQRWRLPDSNSSPKWKKSWPEPIGEEEQEPVLTRQAAKV
jgi:hypothetical protein